MKKIYKFLGINVVISLLLVVVALVNGDELNIGILVGMSIVTYVMGEILSLDLLKSRKFTLTTTCEIEIEIISLFLSFCIVVISATALGLFIEI